MAKAKTVSAPKKAAAKAAAAKQSKAANKKGTLLPAPPATDKVKIGSMNRGQY